MASLAQINIRFAANLKEFSTQMQNMQRDFARVGNQMQDIGKAMSLAITAPLLGIGGLAMKAAADLEQLKTSLNTVFKGNTELSTKAFDTIQKFATETPYGLEEVTQSFIKLKNLGLDASEASLRSYGNTASAMGKSLDQMIEAVADASVGEFERLKEFGIKAKSQGDNVSFTFQGVTTTVGKNAQEITQYLQQVGDVNFAGGMEAQSKTFNGQLAKLKDAVQITMAGFGEILNEMAGPWIEKIANWIESFQQMDPAMKKIIVVAGGLLAAVGPLLTAFGAFAAVLPSIIAGVSSMGAAFVALSGPIGWTIAAIGVIIALMVKNWSSVKKTLIDTANYFIDLYNESMVFRAGVEAIMHVFRGLWNVVKLVGNLIGTVLKVLWNDIKNIVGTIGALFKALVTGNISEIPNIIGRAMKTTVANVASAISNVKDDFSQFTFDVNRSVKTAIGNTVAKRHKLIVDNADTKGAANKIETEVETAVVDGVNNGVDKANKKGKKVNVVDLGEVGSEKWMQAQISEMEEMASKMDTTTDAWKNLNQQILIYKNTLESITNPTEAIVEGSEEWYNREIQAMEEQVSKIDMTTDAYRSLAKQISIYRNTLDLLKNPIEKQLEPEQGTVDWYNYQIDQLKEQRNQAGLTLEEYKRLSNEINVLETTFKLQVDTQDVKEKTEELSDLATSLKDAMESAFNTMADGMLNSFGEAETGLERFAQSMFKTVTKLIAMALSTSIANAIQGATQSGAATGPLAVFSTPAFIATAVGGVMGAFAAIPKFANGGIVSGPTLGIMGEYAGASNNPEVIAPLNKLKQLIEPAGMGNVMVQLVGDFDVKGENLKLVLDRVEKRQLRTG